MKTHLGLRPRNDDGIMAVPSPSEQRDANDAEMIEFIKKHRKETQGKR